MCSSSSQSRRQAQLQDQQAAPLPLFPCTYCKEGMIQWWTSRTTKNPGRHFFTCEHRASGRCNFWKWEDEYVQYIKVKWPALFALDSAAPPPQQPQLKLLLSPDMKVFLVVYLFAVFWLISKIGR